MPRFVAFLRAINVGGHVVKMAALRKIFEELELANVETFIASGNVLFDSRASAGTLESRIENELKQKLGYEVTTFVRSEVEVKEIAKYQAFPPKKLNAEDTTLYIGFLKDEPSKEAQKKLLDLVSKEDEFHFHRSELFWLCAVRMSDSEFSGARLEKTLDRRMTVRNANTIQRLMLKLKDA